MGQASLSPTEPDRMEERWQFPWRHVRPEAHKYTKPRPHKGILHPRRIVIYNIVLIHVGKYVGITVTSNIPGNYHGNIFSLFTR